MNIWQRIKSAECYQMGVWYGNEITRWEVWYGNEVASGGVVWEWGYQMGVYHSLFCTYSWSLQEAPGVWECDASSNQPSCEGASQLKETTATEKHGTVTNDNSNNTRWWVNGVL